MLIETTPTFDWKIKQISVVSKTGFIISSVKSTIPNRLFNYKERRKVAELWSKQYNADIKPEDVNCDGCLSESGRLIGHCKVCEIRKCGRDKNIINCAYCNEYACEKLNQFFKMAPDAKTTLEDIKDNL